MKYKKPVIKNLSAMKVAEGECLSGQFPTGCQPGGMNTSSTCVGGGDAGVGEPQCSFGTGAFNCVNGRGADPA